MRLTLATYFFAPTTRIFAQSTIIKKNRRKMSVCHLIQISPANVLYTHVNAIVIQEDRWIRHPYTPTLCITLLNSTTFEYVTWINDIFFLSVHVRRGDVFWSINRSYHPDLLRFVQTNRLNSRTSRTPCGHHYDCVYCDILTTLIEHEVLLTTEWGNRLRDFVIEMNAQAKWVDSVLQAM